MIAMTKDTSLSTPYFSGTFSAWRFFSSQSLAAHHQSDNALGQASLGTTKRQKHEACMHASSMFTRKTNNSKQQMSRNDMKWHTVTSTIDTVELIPVYRQRHESSISLVNVTQSLTVILFPGRLQAAGLAPYSSQKTDPGPFRLCSAFGGECAFFCRGVQRFALH